MADIDIIPSGDPLGADVVGLDAAATIDDDAMAMVRSAFGLYGVLCFRDQSLEADQFVAFTKRFGDIESYVLSDYTLAGHPEILILSNIVENGAPIGLQDAGATWHTDMSYIEVPPAATILYAREVPIGDDGRVLGDTLFANAADAYDALPDALKARLGGTLGTLVTAARRVPDDPFLRGETCAPRP